MKDFLHIGVFGLNHNTAPIEIREGLYIPERSQPELLTKLKDRGIDEAVVLSTCNRTEIYFSYRDCNEPLEVIGNILGSRFSAGRESLDSYVYSFLDENAYKHLFLVASGLDSMVIGESQILGQVKNAYRLAASHNTTGFLLDKVFHRTFRVAKRIRTETRIGYNPVSISSMAVELSKKIFLDLSRKKILVIGAGEMCEIALKHFKKEGLNDIFITNRTFQDARFLAEEYNGTPYPFEEIPNLLVKVDMVLSSTGSEKPIIDKETVHSTMKKRKSRPLFFIDIAVPRDVDSLVNNIENVYLYDIDDLKDISQRHFSDRLKESQKAHEIMEEEARKFAHWLEQLDIAPIISRITGRLEEVRSLEVKKALAKLKGADKETLDRIDILTKALTAKFLHPHLALIRQNGNPEVLEVMKKLFELEEENEEEMDNRDQRE
ncbi:MAG: glutamyl-tRNA reductase [Syntrophobacterales bacterium]|nr:glutamyl-tRNA reductase [Syntrophobacterales bacterium]